MGRRKETDGIRGKREPANLARYIRKIPTPIKDLNRGPYRGRLHEPSCAKIQTFVGVNTPKAKCTCTVKEYRNG